MHASHFHYLPLTFPFFSILIAIFILIAAFIQIGILRYAYLRLGLSPSAALLVLAGSLIGSYFNIPVAELPERQIVSGEVVDFFGMRYVVPYLAERPETIVAVNVGGALIPGAMSIYLLFQHQLWLRGLIGTACVAAICFFLAQPVPGLGIALPIFVAAVLAECSAACLYQRKPRSADWRRSPQSPADSRARRARRLDWRSGNIRRNFPHRYF